MINQGLMGEDQRRGAGRLQLASIDNRLWTANISFRVSHLLAMVPCRALAAAKFGAEI